MKMISNNVEVTNVEFHGKGTNNKSITSTVTMDFRSASNGDEFLDDDGNLIVDKFMEALAKSVAEINNIIKI